MYNRQWETQFGQGPLVCVANGWLSFLIAAAVGLSVIACNSVTCVSGILEALRVGRIQNTHSPADLLEFLFQMFLWHCFAAAVPAVANHS